MDAKTEERKAFLRATAPIDPRGVWARKGGVVYLCGTLGARFDAWQRSLSAVSSADAYISQMIGLEEIERQMDALEEEAREALSPGEKLLPRRSPGYGDMPLDFSGKIIDGLDAVRRIGVGVTPAGLLVPSKSVTAVCRIVSGEEET